MTFVQFVTPLIVGWATAIAVSLATGYFFWNWQWWAMMVPASIIWAVFERSMRETN